MKGKEMIEEMASDMNYGCVKHDLWPDDAKEIAKALFILDYRKTVTCKHCKHRYTKRCALFSAQIGDQPLFTSSCHNDDFYCARGEL